MSLEIRKEIKINKDIKKKVEEIKDKFPEIYTNDSSVYRAAVMHLYKQRILKKDLNFYN